MGRLNAAIKALEGINKKCAETHDAELDFVDCPNCKHRQQAIYFLELADELHNTDNLYGQEGMTKVVRQRQIDKINALIEVLLEPSVEIAMAYMLEEPCDACHFD